MLCQSARGNFSSTAPRPTTLAPALTRAWTSTSPDLFMTLNPTSFIKNRASCARGEWNCSLQFFFIKVKIKLRVICKIWIFLTFFSLIHLWRILYDTQVGLHHRTAWQMISDMANTKSQTPEVAAFSSSVRTIRAQLAGLSRSNVHFVPFYTKSHLATILDNYDTRIEIYQVRISVFDGKGDSIND